MDYKKIIELEKRISYLEGIIEGKQIALDILKDLVDKQKNNQPNTMPYTLPGWQWDKYATNIGGGVVAGTINSIEDPIYYRYRESCNTAVTAKEVKESLKSFLN
jgi:hypothetical protein